MIQSYEDPYSESSPFFGGGKRRRGCALTGVIGLAVVGVAVIIVVLSLVIASKEQVRARLVFDSAADGDFAFWDPNNQVLYWVDHSSQTINSYNPLTNNNTTRQFDAAVGVVVPRMKYNDSVIVTAGQSVYSLNLTSDETELLTTLECNNCGNDLMQFTDGRCDPNGGLWIGASVFEGRPVGTLFRMDSEGVVSTVLPNVTVPGSMAWSKDKRTFYLIDSGRSAVNAYAYNSVTGVIVFEKVAFTVPGSLGTLSGMAIDRDGSIWIAVIGPPQLNGKGKVCRYDPIRGQLQQTVTLPVSSATSCIFGGPNLEDLYITTRYKPGEPNSGGIFVARNLGVTGVKPFLYSG